MTATQPSSARNALPRSSTSGAGRGGLALAGGKIVFLVTGLIQQIALKSVLGLGAYGALSTAQSVASICYNPLIQSGIQGVSRSLASSKEEETPFIQGRLMKLHALGAVLSAILFLASADAISEFLGAPHIAGGLRLLSIIMLLYGLYAPMVGALNGGRRFFAQAGLDVLSASLRTIGLVAGAYAVTRALSTASNPGATSSQVEGAILGFCAAALLWVLVAARITGLGRSGGASPPLRGYLTMVLPILGGQILLNLLFQADALLLRKFASDAALSTGQLAETADRYVGAYRASQLFCFLPFQLLTSLTFVLFPLLAKAKAEADEAMIAKLIERGLRIATITAGLIISTLVTVPEGLLSVVFGGETSELGASAMRILAGGMGLFALLGVITSAMNSLGAERSSLTLFGVAVALVASLCIAFTRGESLGPELLSRVALATSIAMAVTTLAASVLLQRLTNARFPFFTLTRTILCASLVGWTLSPFFEVLPTTSRIDALVPTALGTFAALIAFALLLFLSRELGRKDLLDLKEMLARK